MAKELSISVDESGPRRQGSLLLAHTRLSQPGRQRRRGGHGLGAKLARADLPNIPFHSEPLMNGHKDYEFRGIEQRKVMLAYFSSFVRKLPISYITFASTAAVSSKTRQG